MAHATDGIMLQLKSKEMKMDIDSIEPDNENSDDMENNALFQKYGRALFNNVNRSTELLVEIGSFTSESEDMNRKESIFGWALDAARFESENGRKKGSEFVQKMENALSELANEDRLTLVGSLALSDCWVTSGLVPPESLAYANVNISQIADMESSDDSDESDIMKQLLDNMLKELDLQSSGSQSQLYDMIVKTLPSMPDSVKYEFVRMAVGITGKPFADIGCTMLLTKNDAVRHGAIDGLSDRLKSGKLKSNNLSKLTVIRSWLEDEGTISRLDELIRESIKKGVQQGSGNTDIELLEICSSAIDGAGTQSIMAAVRNGKSLAVAMLLLKHGRGVKDAFVIPCRSRTELNLVSSQINNNITRIEFYEVPIDFVRQLVTASLYDGTLSGLSPTPGLVEWAQMLGLEDIRPESGSVADILALADPEGKVSGLQDGDLEKLVARSEHWLSRFPIVNYWFESCDETDEILNSDDSQKVKRNRLLEFLEEKRGYWAMCISRTALMQSAAKVGSADEAVAVAVALERGWSLEKIPVMETIMSSTIEIWKNESSEVSGIRMRSRRFESTFSAAGGDPDRWQTQKIEDVRNELGGMLSKANHKLDWVDGYLTAVCTSPMEIDFQFWIENIYDQLECKFKTDEEMDESLRLILMNSRHVNTKLADNEAGSILPADEKELQQWSKGYIAAWTEFELCWPIELTGPVGYEMVAKIAGLTKEGAGSDEVRMEVCNWLVDCFNEIGQN